MNFRFGPYLLEAQERSLRRAGQALAVTPKVFATLLVLVEAHGRAVTREELLAAVWPDSFVEDGSLAQNIFVLRKLLAADFPDGNPIETLPRIGYRFRAPVVVEDVSEHVAAEPGGSSVEQPVAGPAAVSEDLQPQPRRIRLWHWALPLALVLLVMALAWQATSHAAFHSRELSLDLTRLTTKPSEDHVTAAALSPDGRVLAYADADGIVLQAVGDPATHSVRTPPLKKIDHLSWVGDGLHLAVSGVSPTSNMLQIWVLSTVGEGPVLLREDARNAVPAPKGSLVAYTTGNGSEVWMSGLAGEGARRILQGAQGETFPVILWSRDGRHLLLQRHGSALGQAASSIQNPEADVEIHPTYLSVEVASSKVSVSAEDMSMTNACLLRDDEVLFSHPDPSPGTSLWQVRIDPATGGFASKPVQMRDIPGFGVLALGFDEQSGQGITVLNRSLSEVYVGSLQQPGPVLRDVRRLSLDEGLAYPHAWTPDSKAVFFESNFGGRYQIYKQPLAQHDPVAVAATAESQSAARVTPDRHWILFASKPQDGSDSSLFRVPLDGGRPLLVNTGSPNPDFRCPLSGKTCVLRSMEGGLTVFSALDPVTGKGARLFVTPSSPSDPKDWDVSPDGAMLVLIAPNVALPTIRVVHLATGSTEDVSVRVDSRVRAVNWSPDQKGWFVAAATTAGSDLFYVERSGKARWLRAATYGSWGVPSPDGHMLAFVDRNVDSNVWSMRLDKGK